MKLRTNAKDTLLRIRQDKEIDPFIQKALTDFANIISKQITDDEVFKQCLSPAFTQLCVNRLRAMGIVIDYDSNKE